MKTILIAAVAANGVIGANNTIPWRLPSDLKHFSRTTRNNIVLMGSKTWLSLGSKPLPERDNLVLSSKPVVVQPGTKPVASWATVMASSNFEECLEYAKELSAERQRDLYVIGGESVYRQALPHADQLLITHIERDYEGDVYFPPLGDEWDWGNPAKQHRPETQELPYTIARYHRIK